MSRQPTEDYLSLVRPTAARRTRPSKAAAVAAPRMLGPGSSAPRTSVFRRSSVEHLEDRRVLAAPTLVSSLPATFNMATGTAFQIPLDGFDADNDALTYSVAVNSSTVNGFNQSFRQGDLLQIQYQQTGGAAISGTMLFKLFEDLAPRTTDHIKQLASSGFYNNVTFHRILNNFVIQGGDPDGTGSGGSNLGDFDDDFNTRAMHTQTGLLSMAKTTDDTNDSQFFITEGAQRHLDFNHSVYGMLIEGEQARARLSDVPADANGRPTNTVRMTNVQIVADSQNGVLTVVAPNGATGTVNLTVTVSDGNGGTAQLTFTINVTAESIDSVPFLNDAQNPQKIILSNNGSQSFTLQSLDVDSGPLRFINWATIDQIADLGGWSENVRPPQQNANLIVQVTDAGLLTVQATNGISGVFQIMVGVTNFNNTVRTGVDTQIIPVYVNPPTPTLDLLPVSDTGASDSDNVTRLNNSDTGSRLQFQVGNVVPGATVKIFAGTTLIGQATAPTTGGSSLMITTIGAATLLNGINNITATQSLPEMDVAIANFREENVVLTSVASTPLPLTVDSTAPSITVPTIPIAAPGQLLTIDIASNEEGADGFQFALIQRPEGATINAATGAITWTPNVSQAGTHQFTVGTTDKAGNTSQQQFEVKVNSPPQLQSIQNQAVGIGEELNFLVTTLDNDLPNDTLTYSLTNAPAGATITAAENFQGRFRWTPTAGQSGLHSVTVRVTDAGGQFSEQTFQITVDDPEPPQLDAIPDQTVDELAPFTFDANATDGNLPNDTLTFSLVGTVPTGMTINGQTGVISWTPTEPQGPQSYNITVRVTDAFQLTDDDTFTLTVNEVNTSPVIPPIADKVVNAGSELRFTIPATDADLPAQAIGFSLVSAPAGALIDPLTGEFVWTPSPSSQAATETITVRVEDGLGGSAQQTFNVRVNVAPQLEPIADKTADEGQTLTVPAIATDANGVDDTLIYSLVGVAPPGASIDPATGVITFTPTEGQGGQTLTITVRVADEGGLTAETSFDVTVNEINVDPVIAPIGDQRVNLGGTLTVDVNATDSDLPQQNLVFSLDAGAPAGAVIDPASGVITWTPNAGQGIGPHVFTVRVSDGVATVSRTFNVTVNVAPTLDAVTDKTINEGAALSVPLVAGDPNSPNDTLTFSIQSGPSGASINAQTGVFTWTPSESQGPQSHAVTVRVTDSGGLFADRTFNVQVNEVNAPPVIATIGTRNVNEGSALSFNVPATDPDLPANTLTYSVVGTLPVGATLDPVTGVFSWTPSEAQGPQTVNVTVRVQDAGGASDEETFQIVVAEVNTAPELRDIADQTVDEGSALTFTASATDSDTPTNTIRFSLGTGAPAGAAIDPNTGVFTWAPSEAQGPGTFTISIVATDGGGLSDTTTVAVTVREVNTDPSLNAVSRQTVFQGGTLRVNVDAADTDLPANALTFSLADAPEGATIDPQTGEISWRVPLAQSVGVLTITVQVRDAAGATAELTFEVEVQQFDITQLLGSESDDLVDEIQRNNFFEGVGGLGTLDLPAVQRGDALDPLAPITNGNPIAASTDRLQASNDVTLEQNAEEESEEDGERREVRRPSSGDDVGSPQDQDAPRDLGFPNPFGESGTSVPADDEASVAPTNNDLGRNSQLDDNVPLANWVFHSADGQLHLLAGLAHVAAGVFLAGVADSACVIELQHEPTADEYFEARGERFVLPAPVVESVEPQATSPAGIAVAATVIAGPVVVAELAGRRAFYPPPGFERRRRRTRQ